MSSKIEGTQATLGEVLKFDAGEVPEQETKRHDIHEIINYRRALYEAEEELGSRPFNLNLLCSLHSTLLDSVRGRDKSRGEFRTIQNWIGKPHSRIEEAEFIPPEPGETLKSALFDWESYYHQEQPDSLGQLAVVHAQFEILHPFLDGNGRLGRILIPIFLYEKKVLPRPMFYMSAYFERHRDTYIHHLRVLGTSKESWNQWVKFFLEGLTDQAQENYSKAKSILNLYSEAKEKIIALTRSKFAIPLLDFIFNKPIFRSSNLYQLKNAASRPKVLSMLNTLVENKILTVVIKGRGPKSALYAFDQLIEICER